MLRNTGVFPAIPVAPTDQALISHTGPNVLTSFVDALGFRDLREDRFSQFVPTQARHRPGRNLGSLAVMLAGGGEHVSDLDVLRNSPGLFGPVPSNAAVSRFVERASGQPEAFAHGFTTLSRRLRSRNWESTANRNPAALATRLDPLIVDIDATLMTAHSDKELSAGTYKGGSGFDPMIASIDHGRYNGTGGDPGRGAAAGKPGRQQRPGPHHCARRSIGPAARCDAPWARKPGRGEDPGAHRQRRGLPRIPAPPAYDGGAVLHFLRPAGAQRTQHQLDQQQGPLGTSTETSAAMRGSSTRRRPSS